MSEPTVEYNFLGKCGVKVSNICLGTWTFGQSPKSVSYSPRQLSGEIAHKIMDVYASYGGNFLGTANNYSVGKSEDVVGSWLSKQDRKTFVLATKVRFTMDNTNVNSVGLSRRHIVESCEESLERLKTNYIDLYQSHCWDTATPIDETLRTFEDLIRCDKIRYFGVSNVCGWQLQNIVCRLQAMGLNDCVTLQQQYNLLVRQSEFEEFMVCHNEGIGVLSWSPLKGGLLTGKYKRDGDIDPVRPRLGFRQLKNATEESVPDWNEYANDDVYWKLMDALTEVAAAHGKTVPQVALRWLIQKDIVSSVIIGVTSVKQLDDNMGAATGWRLSHEEMTKLDEASVRISLYPYGKIWRSNAHRLNPFNRSYTPYHPKTTF